MEGFLILLGLGLVIGVPLTLVVFVGKFRQMEWRLRQVEDEIKGLRGQLQRSSMPETLRSTAGDVVLPGTEPRVAARQEVPAPPPSPRPQPQPQPSQPRETFPPRLFQEPATPSRTKQEWEALVGGKLLNRIGALALIIGVGFFLKYAFDNNWISESVRVLMGAALGAGLLILGGVSHKKGLAVFAQGILGAGVAVLYLSVYASFNFYHLVSQPVAFGLMAAVTAAAFWQGIRYDSLAIAILGWAGGFLTPFMLDTGHPNAVGLLSYLTVLNCGVLAIVAYKRAWTPLHVMSLVATYLIYSAWTSEYGETLSWQVTVLFLSLWLLAFLAAEIFVQLRHATQVELLRAASAANLILFALAIHLHPGLQGLDTTRGVITLAAAALYFSVYMAMAGRGVSSAEFRGQYAITAVTMLALATLDILDDYRMIIAWSVEATAVFIWGVRKQGRGIWATGLCLFVATAIALLLQENTIAWKDPQEFRLLFNERVLAMVIFAICLGGGAWEAARQLRSDPDRMVAPILTIGWSAVIFLLLTVETTDYFRRQIFLTTGDEVIAPGYLRTLVLSSLWALYALPLMWFGRQQKNQVMVVLGGISVGVAVLACLMLGFDYQPIEHFRLLLNVRFAAFILVIASLVIGGRILSRWPSPIDSMKHLASSMYLAALAVVLLLFTAESWNEFDRLKEAALRSTTDLDKLSRLADLQQLTLSGIWLAFSIILMVLGIWKRTRLLRIVAFVLFGVTILKIFIYDLSFLETLYRIFSFIGLGVILLTVSFLYQKYKGIILESDRAEQTTGEGN